MISLLIWALQSPPSMPIPPAPSDFAAYGFAGIIFFSFFFIVCASGFFVGRYINKRDELWAVSQKEKDLMFKESLAALGASHEKVIERVALSAEKASESATQASEKITLAVRELQKDVALGHQVFSEERITTALRRALREVKHDG